jgi:hypothetical protein
MLHLQLLLSQVMQMLLPRLLVQRNLLLLLTLRLAIKLLQSQLLMLLARLLLLVPAITTIIIIIIDGCCRMALQMAASGSPRGSCSRLERIKICWWCTRKQLLIGWEVMGK